MESSNSLQERLKKTSHELSEFKDVLHLRREYLQSILKNSRDMIFTTDANGVLISLSKGAEEVLGYSIEDMEGNSLKNFLKDSLAFENFMAASQGKGDTIPLELSFRHKDGHTIRCDVALSPLTNGEGQKIGTIGICQDISLWKKFQEDLIQIDRLAEIGRVASEIVHEINNSIAIINEISGWTKTLVSTAKGLTKEDGEELETAFNRINEQTKRCRNIVGQLLGFARDSEPVKTSFYVNEMLKETISFLNPELKSKSIEVTFNFQEGPLFIHSDPMMLEQVFVNIITNAIFSIKKQGIDKGLIELKTSKTGSNVEIMISDNGTGISKEDQDRIFDLFYTTKPPGTGTGLGLPICRKIVKKLGGEITFETQVGEGTSFSIYLPIS